MGYGVTQHVALARSVHSNPSAAWAGSGEAWSLGSMQSMQSVGAGDPWAHRVPPHTLRSTVSNPSRSSHSHRLELKDEIIVVGMARASLVRSGKVEVSPVLSPGPLS